MSNGSARSITPKSTGNTAKLDAAVKRIDDRVKERQRKILEHLKAKDPYFLELRELLKERFDGKIEYFSGGGITYGQDVRGVPVSPPQAWNTLKRKKNVRSRH